MASAPRDLKSRVTDVVTCPICLELFNSPKSLPCLHTFCLKCIEGHCKNNEPGDKVACPVCRREFQIPDNRVDGLVSNFFIADLVEARTASDVVALMTCGKDVLIQPQRGKCDKHMSDDVRLYCFDCNTNVCVICFAEEHQQHKCKNVDTVAVECVKQIEKYMGPISERAYGARKEISRLDEERCKFLAGVEEVGEKILKRGEELKQLIDKQVNGLMAEVQVLKTEKCKEIESHKENVEMKLVAFETFSAYCSELKSKGKPCDITRAANGLHIRATELLQNDVTLTHYRAPAVAFKPMNIHELLAVGQINLVGLTESTDITDKMSNAELKAKFPELHTSVIDMNLSSAVDYLFQEDVLSADDLRDLHSKKDRKQQAQKLLAILHNSRNPQAFIKLREAINREPAYNFIIQRLDVDEQILVRARAVVMVYDNASKKWGDNPRPSEILISQHKIFNTCRILGHSIVDKQVTVNAQLAKDLKYSRATEIFIQWRDPDTRIVYGLSFDTPDEAATFQQWIVYAISLLA